MKIHEPPMQFKDGKAAKLWVKGLANNQSCYGNAVYRYASEWATAMETALAQSDEISVSEVAERTRFTVDDEGITGFMYGCAVSILAAVWVHGEKLRCWHNLDTQIGTEGERANESGGVLNPVILNIGG